MVGEDNRIREERVKREHSMRVGSGGGGRVKDTEARLERRARGHRY